MIIEIKIPSAGESVTEAAVGAWLAEDGDFVEKDQEIAEVESDKATLPLIAPQSGILKIIAQTGKPVNIGDLACTIDTSIENEAVQADRQTTHDKADIKSNTTIPSGKDLKTTLPGGEKIKITPLAKNIMHEHQIDLEGILSGLKKITKNDVEAVVTNKGNFNKQAQTSPDEEKQAEIPGTSGRPVEKIPLSPLRRKLSKRLVSVKNETAMLTTFNEVDMSSVMKLRKDFQDAFQKKYMQKLGLMSFFIKASAEALILFPKVNSMLDNDTLLTPGFVDIAIAVQTDKGLMVPVIRNAQSMSLPELELELAKLAEKARNNRLTIAEMTGGTFTITNGGVFGSMLSTPIINPPQSAILGMHNIVERPVAVNKTIEIKPVMYLALSYDHRVIDGKDSVSFLVKVKEFIESPLEMVSESNESPEKLLGI